MSFDPALHPHRRYNPLAGEWVLVSPHRMRRPWQGRVEQGATAERPAFDPDCYLCPGNVRANGEVNPEYQDTYVFVNDFAALLPEPPTGDTTFAEPAAETQRHAGVIHTGDAPEEATGHHSVPSGDPLLRLDRVSGECRVICFSPRHDLTLARMTDSERLAVVRLWMDQTAELGRRWRWVQVFENRGELMGASNPHPHGQIWSLDRLPSIAAREEACQRSYQEEHGTPLLLDYARRERELRERVVIEEEDWLAVVPYWAVWPFETLLLPLFPVTRLDLLNGKQQASLARMLGRLMRRYDNLFETPFPYSMGWHGAPFLGSDDVSHWQLHCHFYPPLLRSASVRKFMVGFEMLGEAQRDLTPEQAAQRLAGLPERHYEEGR